MSAELIGILSVGVALAALHMASIKGLREEMNVSIKSLREDMKRMENRLDALEQRMENRLDALEQRMARLEGMLDGLREALFERARERVSE